MEKFNFVKNGVIRLPPGFRFHPTDEELVDLYLKRKVFSCPLPASIIQELDVCKSDPWDLPGESAQERYFFSIKEARYPNGNRSNRATASGYWKATGIDKRIVTSTSTSRPNQVVGMKKTLVFYRGKPPYGSKTDWVMHEYRLLCAHQTPPAVTAPQQNNSTQSPMENWVLCRVFLKKSSKNREEIAQSNDCDRVSSAGEEERPVFFYDFLAKNRTDLNLTPASPSSGSSGVTQVSFHELDDHEESSSVNSLSSFRRKP
ncbi:hypothetical protein U1Q18_017348 [Sarracenia purpurea var. burkii]